jgi:uncharacterized membrane protein
VTAEVLERRIGRLLTIGSYLGVGLLAVGVVLLLASGTSPLDVSWPPFDPGAALGDTLALRAAGSLWLGLIVLIATPAARVAVALAGYAGAGDRAMVLVSAGILVVIVTGVAIGAMEG